MEATEHKMVLALLVIGAWCAVVIFVIAALNWPHAVGAVMRFRARRRVRKLRGKRLGW